MLVIFTYCPLLFGTELAEKNWHRNCNHYYCRTEKLPDQGLTFTQGFGKLTDKGLATFTLIHGGHYVQDF